MTSRCTTNRHGEKPHTSTAHNPCSAPGLQCPCSGHDPRCAPLPYQFWSPLRMTDEARQSFSRMDHGSVGPALSSLCSAGRGEGVQGPDSPPRTLGSTPGDPMPGTPPPTAGPAPWRWPRPHRLSHSPTPPSGRLPRPPRAAVAPPPPLRSRSNSPQAVPSPPSRPSPAAAGRRRSLSAAPRRLSRQAPHSLPVPAAIFPARPERGRAEPRAKPAGRRARAPLSHPRARGWPSARTPPLLPHGGR